MTKATTNPSKIHRRHARISTELPTCVKGTQGVTRDISASGLFIMQSSKQEMGSRIDFWVDLDTPGGKLKLCCEGEVVRVEAIDGKFGIGVKILSQVIKSYS